MAKISELPGAAQLDGTEKVPLVKDGVMVQAPYGALANPIVAIVEALLTAIEAAAGPNYGSTAEGLAATTAGASFPVDNGDGTVTVYLNDGGIAVPQRELPTTAFLASTYARQESPTFRKGASFATDGSRVGITDGPASIIPNAALFEIRGNGVNTLGLRVSQRWTGTTAAPYQNNDTTLFETHNTILSDSTNYSWSVSAPNGYNDIPAGVTDSGYRIGVYGWAVSVHVPGEYEHAGILALQVGVRGRAGFQGTGSVGTVTDAFGVLGEIYNDASGATVVNGVGVGAASNAVDGTVQNAYGVRASATGGTVSNWSFYGDAGKLFNQDQSLFGEDFSQFDSSVSARGVGSRIEFGFPDVGGYGSGLGAMRSSGRPFLAFAAENQSGDLFTTRGDVGHVMWDNLDGGMTFSRAVDPNEADQALTDDLYWDANGRFQFARTPIFPAYAPASATDTGQTGQFCWDADYLYICVGTNAWRRVAISAW